MPGFARAASSDLGNPLLEIRGDGEDVVAVRGNYHCTMVTSDQSDVDIHDVGVSASPHREPDSFGHCCPQGDGMSRPVIAGAACSSAMSAPESKVNVSTGSVELLTRPPWYLGPRPASRALRAAAIACATHAWAASSGRSSLGLPLLTAQETLQFGGELLA